MLGQIRGWPLMMQRFPEGIDHPGSVRKDVDGSIPDWFAIVKAHGRGATLTQAIACNAPTLAYLADRACITPPAWLSRALKPGSPDLLVFDLDPSPGVAFLALRDAALGIGEQLGTLGLAPFAMTAGSEGIHLWAPLRGRESFEEVRRLAGDIAELLSARHPATLTTPQRRSPGGRRVYIDIMRNAYGQTAVVPHAVRARPGAPAAMPIRWEEVRQRGLRPDRLTIAFAWERLAAEGDVWAPIARHTRGLQWPRWRLEACKKSSGDERERACQRMATGREMGGPMDCQTRMVRKVRQRESVPIRPRADRGGLGSRSQRRSGARSAQAAPTGAM